ncbi:PEPxxWA-CTERM sorting domain-containing protein [Sphingorhabdus sp.]
MNHDVVDSVAAVPEPTTWALFLLGFFGVGGAMRSKTRKSNASVTYA